MKYSELQPTLQNLTNEDIKLIQIAEILNVSSANMNYKVKSAKGDVPIDEIRLLEDAFGVSLIESVKVDYYPDVFGSCDNSVFELSPEKQSITVPKSAFFTKFSPNKTYSVIKAKGDSMKPFITDGDRLIIEHWDGEQIVDNRPYIFCYRDKLFIKRLVYNINEIVIKSDNSEYNTIILSDKELDKLLIVGQVVGLMRDLR